MKKAAFFIYLLFFTVVMARGQEIPPKPNPPRLVNDISHVMTPDQVSALESKLVAYDDSTSVQIAIVTVPSIGDNAPQDYALKILRDWGVGNKKTNNGMVILAVTNAGEHKVFIATGYGMEGSVPDIIAKQIVDNEILPSFKKGDYYSGFDHAADAIIKAAAGEYKAPAGYRKNKGGGGGGSILGIIIIIFIILLLVSRGGGGGGGLFSGSGMLPWILASMLNDGGGRGGGGWSGGGGGGGGGFGGFGGGSGGGGGAGGSW